MNTSTESAGIRSSWSELKSQIDVAARHCSEAADNCSSHAKNIDEIHSEIVNVLAQFGAGAGITAILPVGLIPLTLGLSDVAGAGLAAGEVAATVARVTAIGARFLGLCRSLMAEFEVMRVAFTEWRISAPALQAQAAGSEVARLSATTIRIASSTLSTSAHVLVDLTLGAPGARGLATAAEHGLVDPAAIPRELTTPASNVPEWLTRLLQRANLPRWRRQVLEGQKFNYENAPRYTARGGFNEVTLKGGKRVDSYIPGEEIVSRKFTQLADHKPSVARGYINEMTSRQFDP